MNQNPYLRVLVCGGRCDLVCPIDTIRHSLEHMPLAEATGRTSLSRNSTPAT